MSLVDRLLTADRAAALSFMSVVVHELTLVARAAYDQPDGYDRLVQANEAIHRLSGHLRDLLEPAEALTASRAEGVAAQTELLGTHGMARALSHLTR